VTHLYSRHIYVLVHSLPYLNCWVVLSEEARSELLFLQQLPRLHFAADVWPCVTGLSIRIAMDARDFAWGSHTMTGPLEIAREYFSESEAVESSTLRQVLGACSCLQSLVHRCEGRFVVLPVDAHNFLGIVNRGSSKLPIKELAREFFWFCLRHRITISVEWVPLEENAFADEISKMLIPEDWMLSRIWFQYLDYRWGPHTADLFASNANNQCARFFSLH